jgi:hypothetical protein
MVRTIQIGPQDLVLFGVTLFGERFRTLFKIPGGATVTLVSIMPPRNTPPTWVRATLVPSPTFDNEDFEAGQYPYQLIPAAYPWGPADHSHAAVWEGRHRVDEDFEYTLEVLVHDGSGASPSIWKAIVIMEVEE